jgi:YkoY family integral membrane protein
MLNFTPADAPLIAWYIGVLVFLEGLLSADNALVLALMVRHLPKKEQRQVLQWGIWGAVGFRLVAVLLSAVLIRFWIFKVLGGLYLLYLALAHFVWPGEDEPGTAGTADGKTGTGSARWLRGFWGTVTSVTMADIAFSIDSILAAVAMADSFPARFGNNGKLFIVFVGGVLGIITMRFVVRYFVILLDRFPGLAEAAYWLVAWIGLKLVISGLHDAKYLGFHVPEALFWSVMIGIAVLGLVLKPRRSLTQEAELSDSLDLLEANEEPASEEADDSKTSPLAEGSDNGITNSDGAGLLRPESDRDQSPEQASSGRTP